MSYWQPFDEYGLRPRVITVPSPRVLKWTRPSAAQVFTVRCVSSETRSWAWADTATSHCHRTINCGVS